MKHLFLLLTLLSFSLTALAQQKVTGKVKDSSGEPVIGASVVVKGNNTMGTITDFDGNFMLDVPAKSVLVISYIGYVTQEVPTDPVRNEDGTWNENVSKFEYENPLALLYEAEGNVKKTQLRYNGNIVPSRIPFRKTVTNNMLIFGSMSKIFIVHQLTIPVFVDPTTFTVHIYYFKAISNEFFPAVGTS
jgi:hypothetical protein